MLVYCSTLKYNDEFNENILKEMFINWMQHTKNRIEHFIDDKEVDIIEDNKHVIFKYFDDIFVIHYVFIDISSNITFTIDLVYHINDKQLTLSLYKEATDASYFFQRISLPKIFNDLIYNDYILKEYDIYHSEKPIYKHSDYVKKLKQYSFTHPIVIVYYSGKKPLLNVYSLSKNMLGLGHVFVVRGKDRIEIIYKRNYQEIIKMDKPKETENNILYNIRHYTLKHRPQLYSYLSLKKQELSLIHDDHTQTLEEFKESYAIKQQVYQENIDLLKDEIEIRRKRLEYLRTISNKEGKKPLIVSSSNYAIKQRQLVQDIINKTINDLESLQGKTRYRKYDILKSMED